MEEAGKRFVDKEKDIFAGVNEARTRLAGTEQEKAALPKLVARVVTSNQTTGMELQETRAFVREAVIQREFGCTPQALGLPITRLKDIEGQWQAGVIIREENIPEGMPWSRVVLFSRTEHNVRVVLLSKEDQFRA